MKKTFFNFLLGACIIAVALVSCKKSSPEPEPEKTKSETAIENLVEELNKQPEVTTFSEALKNITLSEDDVKEGLTILAPTNEALKDYRPNAISYSKNSIKTLADTNAQKLTPERLKDHIVKGVLTKSDFTDGKVFTTLSGKALKVTVDGEEIKINGVALAFVSSSSSQTIYTIPQVLTNTDTKIYLPVKFTYTVDDTITANVENITYVGNTQLVSSIEGGMQKREFIYNGDKLQKAIYYQKDMVTNGWKKQTESIYELNSNGEIKRINTKRPDGANLGYQLYTYNSQKVASIKYYSYREPEFAEYMYTHKYEYDMFGNIEKLTEFTSVGDTLNINYEYDNKNGIYKYVKNQAGSLYKNNNVINNSVSHPNAHRFSNTYLEYNSAGFPTKYKVTSSTTSVPATVTVEYIEQ